MLDAAEAEAVDSALAARPWRGDGAVAGLSFPRTRLAEVLEIASAYANEMVVRVTLGVAEARVPESPEVVAQLRTAVARLGGHVTLHRGGAALGGAAWPDPGPEVALMRALKRSLDPAGVLAPGRALGDGEDGG